MIKIVKPQLVQKEQSGVKQQLKKLFLFKIIFIYIEIIEYKSSKNSIELSSLNPAVKVVL